jgi:cell filamentation protein
MNTDNTGRYSVPSDEDIEPGSTDGVLKNLHAIKDKMTMEATEEKELKRTELDLLTIFDKTHQFTAEDISDIHELWLGDIYPFAGKYRTVNMSKDDFLFATPSRILPLMKELQDKYLAKYTPCNFVDLDDIARALAVVHVELILIHPFREGNGRTARLLADLMTMQADKPPLNFSAIDQTLNPEGFKQYIMAIQAGISSDYEPIKKIFMELFE